MRACAARRLPVLTCACPGPPSPQCPVYRYDEEEWASLINEPGSSWTRAETDYLINMVEQFDQRFIVIADRWDVSACGAGTRARRAPSCVTLCAQNLPLA